LPERHRENFVRFAPWCALAFLPFHLLAMALVLGLTAFGAMFGAASIPSAVVALVGLVLSVLALPGLFRRTRRGWALFTSSLVVGLLGSAITFSLFGIAIDVALLWLAFQVKYHYA
jgi:membrane protein YdbS with pleckstrin-like domain